MPETINRDARQLARHALGLTKAKVAYRNRFIASQSHQVWERMVRQGFAERTPIENGNHLYSVTTKGFEAVTEPDESHDGEIGI